MKKLLNVENAKIVLWFLFVGTIAYNICTRFECFRFENWYGEFYEVEFPSLAYAFILIWVGFLSVMLNKLIINKINEKKVKFGIKFNLTFVAILIGIMLGVSDTNMVLISGMILMALVVLTIPMMRKVFCRKAVPTSTVKKSI